MPHLTTGTPEHTALQALAERMGAAEFTARLRAERQMRARRGVGHSRGWFRFEHYWDFYGVIRIAVFMWTTIDGDYFHNNNFILNNLLFYCITYCRTLNNFFYNFDYWKSSDYFKTEFFHSLDLNGFLT